MIKESFTSYMNYSNIAVNYLKMLDSTYTQNQSWVCNQPFRSTEPLQYQTIPYLPEWRGKWVNTISQ